MGGGSFDSILKTCSNKGFFHIEKVSKKKTHIYPNIPLIKKEIEAKKSENLEYGNKRLIRIIPENDIVHANRPLVEPPIKISYGLDVMVKRADPEQVRKRPKRISSAKKASH